MVAPDVDNGIATMVAPDVERLYRLYCYDGCSRCREMEG